MQHDQTEPHVPGLLQNNLPRLHAYMHLHAGHLVRAKESCSDLVQSVCRTVLQSAGDYRHHSEEAFRHWLFTTARNRLIAKHRYYSRERRDARREVAGTLAADSTGCETQAPPAVMDHSQHTPSRELAAREELAAVVAAIQQLPEDYREVITLARIADLSHREIAQRMGRTEVATRHLLVRGLARLSALLVNRS